MRANVLSTAGILALVAIGAPQGQTLAPPWKNDDPAIFARPPLKAAPGFTATLVVPPGVLFDPLTVVTRPGGAVWINDDGGVSGATGGYVWGVDATGRVSTIVDVTEMMPAIGMDIAPAGFGKWGGQIFTVATPTSERVGVRQAHIIQRIDPKTRQATTICTLPNHGTVSGGVPGAGTDVRFGPAGSAFANRLFVITIMNNAMYQVTADAACTPFAIFDGAPQGLAFTGDASQMLVAVRRGTMGTARNPSAKGAIMAVGPTGVIESTPVYEHSSPMIKRLGLAPATFGQYGGELFFTDWGNSFSEGADKPPMWDGALYRVSRDGTAHLVASGLSNPVGFAFTGKSVWIADVNRDGPFIQAQWVPEGFVVRLDLSSK